jgi:hypothetical protein
VHYDLCDPQIRCNADKEGATVFEVQRGGNLVRVLTFDEQRAEELAASLEHPDSPSPEECGLLLF